jgi:syntaxin 16
MSSLPAPSTSSPSSSTLIPTTRSRTLLFISYRDSSSRAPRKSRATASRRQYEEAYQPSDENEGLIDHQATMPHISLDVELPPKWFVKIREGHIFPNISHLFY